MGWIAAAIGIGSAIGGIFGSNQQKDVDDQQVELAFRDNMEKIRRRKFEQAQTQGAAKAYSENAGVTHHGGSTAQVVLDSMANEFRREIGWMTKFASEARKLGHKSAKVRAQAGRFGSIMGGIQTGASIYGASK